MKADPGTEAPDASGRGFPRVLKTLAALVLPSAACLAVFPSGFLAAGTVRFEEREFFFVWNALAAWALPFAPAAALVLLWRRSLAATPGQRAAIAACAAAVAALLVHDALSEIRKADAAAWIPVLRPFENVAFENEARKRASDSDLAASGPGNACPRVFRRLDRDVDLASGRIRTDAWPVRASEADYFTVVRGVSLPQALDVDRVLDAGTNRRDCAALFREWAVAGSLPDGAYAGREKLLAAAAFVSRQPGRVLTFR